MFSTLLSFIPNLLGIGKGYVEKKMELKVIDKQGEIEIKKAKVQATIDRIKNNDSADNSLDAISLKDRGLKDDYLLLLTTMPLILLFVSPIFSVNNVTELQAAVMSGFDALEHCPEYYWYALAIIYIDTFGFRRMFRMIIEKKLGMT